VITIERQPGLPWPLTHVCRGPDGCGAPLQGEDVDRHKHWHFMHGDSVELEQSGANDPGLMPPRT